MYFICEIYSNYNYTLSQKLDWHQGSRFSTNPLSRKAVPEFSGDDPRHRRLGNLEMGNETISTRAVRRLLGTPRRSQEEVKVLGYADSLGHNVPPGRPDSMRHMTSAIYSANATVEKNRSPTTL